MAEATAALPLTLPASPHCDTTVRVVKLGRWVHGPPLLCFCLLSAKHLKVT